LIGEETFGFDRYLNQNFYRSIEWKRIRDYVIIRDGGLDLACEDHPIIGKIYVHHMNPINQMDIVNKKEILLDPEYLISVSSDTHNAIHYGGLTTLPQVPKERKLNDTILWKTRRE
jgi:hypothetical protein